jgi:hypothetical protein
MNAMNGDGAYAFDPVRGLVVDLETPLSAEIHSPNGEFRLNMILNTTGRVVLCSEDSTHAVPGYELCPSSGWQVEEPPVITTEPPISTGPSPTS